MVGRHQLHTVWVAVGETRRAKALATIIAEVARDNQGPCGPRLAAESPRRRQRDM